MVVVGACITTRSRPLLARQFVEISKAKVEALLHAFVKLVEFSGSEHTYLETEAVRYVYQPVEGLYLVLVTTKNSNIFEDLSTLRMFVSIVQDTCSESASSNSLEEAVVAKAFDIIFMLDELISCGGHRESLTLQQIQSFVAMDSNEEKIQRIIAEGKEKEQNDRRREIALRLQRERQQAKAKAASAAGAGGSIISSSHLPSERPSFLPFGSPQSAASNIGSPDTRPSFSDHAVLGENAQGAHRAEGASHSAVGRGMRLKGGPSESGASSILQNLIPEALPSAAAGGRGVSGGGAMGSDLHSAAHITDAQSILERPIDAEPLSVSIAETVKASLQAEGALKEVEVQGTFTVTVNDAQRASLPCLQLSPESDGRYKLRSHPIVDKAALSNSRTLKIAEGRSLAPHQPAPLLKWRVNDRDEALLPLSVSCWPSAAPGGATSLSIELEVSNFKSPLRDLRLSLMCPSQANPRWTVPCMGEELPTASIELVANADLSTLLPFSVEFCTDATSNDISVTDCAHQETGERLAFALRRESSFLLTVSA